MLDQWKEHLYRDYDFVPTEADQRFIVKWFLDGNGSFLQHENWNAARRMMVRLGRWSDTMQTESERLEV